MKKAGASLSSSDRFCGEVTEKFAFSVRKYDNLDIIQKVILQLQHWLSSRFMPGSAIGRRQRTLPAMFFEFVMMRLAAVRRNQM